MGSCRAKNARILAYMAFLVREAWFEEHRISTGEGSGLEKVGFKRPELLVLPACF